MFRKLAIAKCQVPLGIDSLTVCILMAILVRISETESKNNILEIHLNRAGALVSGCKVYSDIFIILKKKTRKKDKYQMLNYFHIKINVV